MTLDVVVWSTVVPLVVVRGGPSDVNDGDGSNTVGGLASYPDWIIWVTYHTILLPS